MTRLARLLSGATAAVVAGALVLAGCSPYRPQDADGRGQSSQDAVAAVEAVDGVESATFEAQPWDNPGEGGLFSSAGMNFELSVTIAPDVHVTDPVALVRFLSQTAWSVNDTSPKGSLSVTVTGGVPPGYDWTSAARTVLDPGPQRDSAVSGGTTGTFTVSDATAASALGRWPFQPADVTTATFLAPGAPAAQEPPAIGDLSLDTFTVNDSRVVRFNAQRTTVGTQTYTGEITVSWFKVAGTGASETVPVHTSTADTTRDGRVTAPYSVGDASDDVDDYRVVVDLAPQDGFDTTSITY